MLSKSNQIAPAVDDPTMLQLIEKVARRNGYGTAHFDVSNALLDLNEEAFTEPKPDPADYLEFGLSRMRFSELLMFRAVSDLLACTTSIQSSVNEGAGTKLCLFASLPGDVWETAFTTAATIAIDVFALTHGLTSRDVSFASLRYRHGVTDIESLHYEHMSTRHVIVMRNGDHVPPPVLQDLCDTHLFVDVTPDAIEFAMKRLGCAGPVPNLEDVSAVEPRILDLLSARFGAGGLLSSKIATAAISARDRRSLPRVDDEGKPFTKAPTKAAGPQLLRPTSPVIADLSGYAAVASWGEQLAEDVRDYNNGSLSWSDVDQGCLLSGPPGTGKTIFASALAATCRLPIIASSFSQWQASKSGYLGDVIKSMRELFETANKHAPCIVFIDEIDSIPSRGGSVRDDYWTPVVNGLLECLDGTNRRDGVIVVAACNNADSLDQAIVRSGRLDRQFEIGLPDEEALVGIFAHHLPGIDAETIAPVATALAGTISGADVARIAREARRSARRQKRAIVGEDLLSIAMPEDTRPEEMRWRVAVHEGGHAIAAMAVGRMPIALSLVATPTTQGIVHSGPATLFLGIKSDIDDSILVSLAGRAAEEAVFGDVCAGAADDLQRATTISSDALRHWGLGDRLHAGAPIDGDVIEGHLRQVYDRALELMRDRRVELEALALLALEKRVLGRAALATFAQSHGLGEVRR